jgi:hypothetical protein
MAWWDQADLAASWRRVSGGMGQIVDIRAVRDLQKGVAETLKYVFKPTNLLAWGGLQVAEFNALGRTKLRECYGAMRGLVGEIEDDGEDELGIEPEERPLVEGEACPTCDLPLRAWWVWRGELCGTDVGSCVKDDHYGGPSRLNLAERKLWGASTPFRLTSEVLAVRGVSRNASVRCNVYLQWRPIFGGAAQEYNLPDSLAG